MGESVSFDGELLGIGNNAGIEVPPEVIEPLGAGKRPPVLVNVNDFEYRSTVAVMGGRYLISHNAAQRKESGINPGDRIYVTLTVADTPREFDVPADFAAALEAAGMRPFFDGLANGMQRFHVDNINGAKTDETRQRRVEKAVGLFTEGKKR